MVGNFTVSDRPRLEVSIGVVFINNKTTTPQLLLYIIVMMVTMMLNW